MKKLFKVLCVILIAVSLCACGITKEDAEQVIDGAQQIVEEAQDIVDQASEIVDEAKDAVGGWTYEGEAKAAPLDDELMEVFEKGCEGFAGQGFEPICLMGTQVVSGTNFMFLAKGTTVTAEPKTALKVVTIYKDIQGNCSILNVADFELINYLFDNSLTIDQLAGGWNINSEAEAIEAEPLDKATSELLGANYKAIAQLATQVVAGVNYCYLTVKTIVAADPVSTLSVVTVYQDLEGNCSVLSICDLNLADYNK